MGSSSTCKVAGYWYSAGMHLVFCTGVDELLSIVSDEKVIWRAGEIGYTTKWVYTPYCQLTPEARYNMYILGGVHYSVARIPPTSTNPCTCPDTETQECVDNWELQRVSYTQSPVFSNTKLFIDKDNIFGGTDRSGGVKGYVSVEFGLDNQGRNPYLVSKLGANIPANRGVFGLVLEGTTLSCNSPQIKAWSIRARRTTTGWLPLIDRIGDDMNPIHIVEECLFSAKWGGVGLPISKRGDSFEVVANLIYNEGFGLSFTWSKNESIEDFIGTVLRHIDCVLYQDYITGKLELKLIRNDYGTPSSLPKFDVDNIVSFEDYKAKSTAELINTVTIKYTDPTNGKDQSVTLTDLSAVDRNGGVVNVTEKAFYGVSISSIAIKIATRELRASVLPLATATILVTRDAINIKPGDVINVTWLPLGFVDSVMRVTSVDIGSLDSSVIRIDCVLDVFAFGDSVLVDPPDSGDWVDPISDPVDIIEFTAREATYWQVSRNQQLLTSLDVDVVTLLHVTAKAPESDYSDFELWDRIPDDLDFKVRASGTFSEYFTTVNNIPQEIESNILLNTPLPLQEIISGVLGIGNFAYLGEELIYVIAINETMDVITVKRGITDTVPVAHPIGTTIQFISNAKCALDNQQFVEGDLINFKMLPNNSNGRLYIDDATEQNYTFLGRLSRSYPPGNVMFGALRYPEFAVKSYLQGKKFPTEFSTVTVKAIAYGTSYEGYMAVDPYLSLTGASINNGWQTTVTTTAKISIDYNTSVIFSSIRISNFHETGASTNKGIKDFSIYGSNDPTSLNSDYSDLTNLTLLGDFVAKEHTLVDEADPQYFNFDNILPFQYYIIRIHNNYGATNLGIRALVFGFYGWILSYAHRDRISQIASTPIPQSAGGITSEPGVSYNISITDIDTSIVVHTENTPEEYSKIDALDPVSYASFSLESERNLEISHQKHEFNTRLVGYGKNYGYSYGGL